MVRSHLNRIPPIWLFFGSLLLLAVAGQAAANLVEEVGQPNWIGKQAEINGQTISSRETVPSSSLQDIKPMPSREVNPESFKPMSEALPLVLPAEPSEPVNAAAIAPLTISKRGFSQIQDRVAYAFIVTNPNSKLAVTNSEYHIEFYDKAGRLLTTASQFIALILPDQTLGIAGTLDLNNEFRVYTIAVNIRDGDVIQDVDFPVSAVGRANFQPGEYFNRTTGLIKNRSGRDFEDIKISAIAYDEKGQIIGSGHTFLPFLFASTSTRVDINMQTTGTVSKVELYPRASY